MRITIDAIVGLLTSIKEGLRETSEDPSLKRRLKIAFLIVQCVAVFLVVLGWYLDHASQTEWIVKLFAPRYASATQLCDLMFDNLGSEFGDTTPGFTPVSSVLSDQLESQFPNQVSSDIALITVTGRTAIVVNPDPNRSGPRLTLSVVLQDGRLLPEVEVPVAWLRSEIAGRYLEEPLFRWGEGLLLSGVIIALATLIAEKVFDLI
jgi:hypothetical protein